MWQERRLSLADVTNSAIQRPPERHLRGLSLFRPTSSALGSFRLPNDVPCSCKADLSPSEQLPRLCHKPTFKGGHEQQQDR
jgi:hypothetical protein